MRGGRSLTALMFAVVIASLARPAPAFAHATLIRSDPPNGCALLPLRLPPNDPRCAAGAVVATPPAAVHLWFSESVRPFGGGISVIGPSGRRVDHAPARTNGTELSVDVDATEEGTYQVRWRVISNDTHPARGEFAFSVGHASAAPRSSASGNRELGAVSPSGLFLQALARWLHFAGFALGFGPLLFLLIALRPLGSKADGPAQRRLWRLVNTGVLTMVAAGVLALLAQVLSLGPLQELDADTLADILASSFGRILAVQMGVAFALWILLGVVQYGSSGAAWAALGTGLALAFVDGGSTHAATAAPAWLGLTLNTVHLATMGAWAGGLAALLATWGAPDLDGRRSLVMRRFGQAAAICLAVLVLGGAAMAWLLLGHQPGVADSAYGRTLALKALAVLAVMLLALLGARSRLPLRRRWWTLEAAGLAGVLALAGLLVSLPPPR